MASGIIEHEGIVSRVEGDRVYVKITSQSACGTCKAREACGLAEAQEKIVEVTTPGAQQHYTAGESVTVGGAGRGGRRAGMERRPQRLGGIGRRRRLLLRVMALQT